MPSVHMMGIYHMMGVFVNVLHGQWIYAINGVYIYMICIYIYTIWMYLNIGYTSKNNLNLIE